MPLSELCLKIFYTAAVLALVTLLPAVGWNSPGLQSLLAIFLSACVISAIVGIIAKIWEE